MKTDPNGGRSSATPNERSPDDIAEQSSRSSPLHGPRRKKPAYFPTVDVGFRSIIIFLTVCAQGRRPLLANNEAVQLVMAAWRSANFWRVGRYVIMPDHIQLFCAPNMFPPRSLKNRITFWRNHVTRAWPVRHEIPIWQRDYWDRQLRRGESYAQKWDYVLNNPVRHGYVARAEEWPYQGELNVYWHD